MSRFDGNVALVTGSTQGIGEAVARRFASEGAAGVVVTGRDEARGRKVAQSLEEMGSETLFVKADLSDPGATSSLIEATDEYFGRIDVLVNAAGLSLRGSITDTTVKLWDELFAVNVRAPFILMQGAIRIMRREKIEGSIVNIGSVTAHGGPPHLTPYSTTKAALSALTKNVAYSVIWDRIRVNIINPGWMDTPGEDVIQRRFHSDGDDWLEDAERSRPFGKLIKPDEVAAIVAFVASGDAGVMTGSVVHYDQSILGAGDAPVPSPEGELE